MSEETKVPGTQDEQPAAEQAGPAAEPASGAARPSGQEQAAPADTKAEQPAADDKKTDQPKQKKDWFGGKTAKELEATKAKLEAAEKKSADLRDQLLRTAAEYDNFRKRSAREADRKFNDGISHAVTQILGILDTLDMAANAACSDENYKKGVVMTLDKAAKALDTLHVTEIEALGKPFDPNFMNAVQQVPPAEGQESGSVVQVFQKGYMIGDKVIRHATVVVAE